MNTENATGPAVLRVLNSDLRFTIRTLCKNPLFTTVAVLTLAIGIGLSTAVFSAVHALIFRPLPGAHQPDELVQLYRATPGSHLGWNSIPHYQDLRDRAEAFDGDVAAWTLIATSLATDDSSERVLGSMVSANFFDVFGSPPALGRGFLPEEADDPGAHRVVVLGHAYWQSRFAADPSIIGREVIVNGRPWVVVGVAQKGFKGPIPFFDPHLFAPLMMQQELIPGEDLIEARGNNCLKVTARLAPGINAEQAQENLVVVMANLREEFPDVYDNVGMNLVPQQQAGMDPSFRSGQVGISIVLMVVVGFLLLITCINVAHLSLARAGSRIKEMGVRQSIGAGSRRIMSLVMTESMVVAAVAGGIGLLLAWWAISILNSITLPADLPVDFNLTLNPTIVLFSLAVTTLTGVLFGLAPAIRASKVQPGAALKGDQATLAKMGAGRFFMNALVTTQIALSILLLVSSGLFLRGLQQATAIDKGFEEENLLVASLDPGLQAYDRESAETFYRSLTSAIATLPGVEAVGLGRFIQLSASGGGNFGVEIPDYEPAPGEGMSVFHNEVTPGYFAAMGISMTAGRAFGEEDHSESLPVMIVNQQFADRFWPGENAVGKLVHTGGKDRRVIGVVTTGKYFSLGEEPLEFMYFPQAQQWTFPMTVHVRTVNDPQAFAPLLRQEVRRLDPTMPVADLRPMTDQLGVVLFPARIIGASLGIFGALGMILAAVGIYGVISYSMSRMTREIGIRVSLGALHTTILVSVVRKSMILVGLGVALGLTAAIGASRLLAGFIYGVDALDPLTFVGVPLVLAAVALIATMVPAWRAVSIDPAAVLRTE